jgi:hypothetical protein
LFDDVPAAEVQDVVVADDLPTTFRDTAIMADNLPRIGKKKAKAEIDKALSEAYKLPENQAVWGHLGTNWQDMDASKLGGSVLKSFSERAVEMISYVHTVEFAKLAKQAGIPNIRGIKLATRKGVNGAMGGGVLHLRTEAIEAYVNTAKIRDLDLISEEMRAAKIRRFEVQDDLDKFNEKTGGDMFFSTSKLSAEDLAEYERLNAAFKKADTEYRTLNSEYMAARDAQRRGAGGSVATYKVGGDILERPWSTKEYFPDGLDKVRALMFHEFGHHIHQSYRINDAYSRSSYVEKILQKFFKETARSELEYWAPSSYAMSNEYEYFVESLVMYIFDRKDMTHPKMIALIDEVLNVKN